jgi:hypothetical protein
VYWINKKYVKPSRAHKKYVADCDVCFAFDKNYKHSCRDNYDGRMMGISLVCIKICWKCIQYNHCNPVEEPKGVWLQAWTTSAGERENIKFNKLKNWSLSYRGASCLDFEGLISLRW